MYKAILIGCLALGTSCTYRMGRGLPTDPSLALGSIQANTSIQGAEELLATEFARELARRSGDGAAQTIGLELLLLDDSPTASGSRQSRLRLAIALVSDSGQRVEVAGSRVYVGSSKPLENAQHREHAIRVLSRELCQEGIPQFSISKEDP